MTHPDIEHMERTGEPFAWSRVRTEQLETGEYVITIQVVGAAIDAEQFTEAVEEAIDVAGFKLSAVVSEAEPNDL